jgi:MFS family permease
VIRTLQKSVSWWAITLLTTTTGVQAIVEATSGAPLTFTLKKFIDDPALIAFLGSINLAFSFLVAPYVSWKSDRIWTRFGRRRPFLIAGWSVLALALIACPLAPQLWLLVVCVVVWQFAADFGYGAVWSPLLYEVVPPAQRGRTVVIKRLVSTCALVFFNAVLLSQFDAVHRISWPVLGVFTLTGEQVIYFVAAGLVLLAVLNLILNLRETEPVNRSPGESFRPLKYFREVFATRQWVMIYLLLFCSVSLSASLGQLSPLLITEQFGYSKKLLGEMQTWQLLLNVFVALPIAGLIADRFDRFRVFQAGLFLSTLHSLVFWTWVKFGTPGGIPAPAVIIAFGLANAIVDTIAALALEPFFYDLTPPNKMGTMNSGFLIVSNILRMVLVSSVGLWVKFYSTLFAAPGTYDYLSGYLFIFLVGLAGVAVSLVFDRERRAGRVVSYAGTPAAS